jgi:hypothetical protein
MVRHLDTAQNAQERGIGALAVAAGADDSSELLDSKRMSVVSFKKIQ